METLRRIQQVIEENELPENAYHLHVGTDASGKLEITHTFFRKRLDETQVKMISEALGEKKVQYQLSGGTGHGSENLEVRHSIASPEANYKIVREFAEVQEKSLRNRDRLSALIERLEQKN